MLNQCTPISCLGKDREKKKTTKKQTNKKTKTNLMLIFKAINLPLGRLALSYLHCLVPY